MPFYAKTTIILIGIFVLVAILYIAQDIIVPIVFSTIMAILILPVVNFFIRRRINRIIAILITLLLTFIIIIAFCVLMYSQIIRFSDSWPLLVDKFTLLINQTINWISGYFDINQQNILDWIAKTKKELLNMSGNTIGQTLLTLGNWIIVIFLIPVYMFLILFYKPLILEVIHKLFGASHQSHLSVVITQIKTLIQRYLLGLVIEFVIVSVLNVTALLILGVDYAILLGILGGLLNVIPYIGGLIAVALPMIVALTTKTTAWYAFYVLAAYYFIQIIDNNYIVPKIVASKVKINALFSIIAVFVGNAVWGVTGMFLSIPLLAIIKLIFDHIEPLKPWGLLLGDTMPHILKLKLKFKKVKL